MRSFLEAILPISQPIQACTALYSDPFNMALVSAARMFGSGLLRQSRAIQAASTRTVSPSSMPLLHLPSTAVSDRKMHCRPNDVPSLALRSQGTVLKPSQVTTSPSISKASEPAMEEDSDGEQQMQIGQARVGDILSSKVRTTRCNSRPMCSASNLHVRCRLWTTSGSSRTTWCSTLCAR